MLRIIADIKASLKPDHLWVPRIIRTPWKMFADCRTRRMFLNELTNESNAAHEEFLEYINTSRFCGYSAELENYVLSFVPDFVYRNWVNENFRVRLVSFGFIANIFKREVMRGRVKADRSLDNVNGLYCPASHEVLVREGTYPQRLFMSEQFWENTEDVCGHEIGHYVDDILGFPSQNNPIFLRAYMHERYFLETYSSVESREFFATAFWVSVKYPKLAKKYIPRTNDFFGEFVLESKQ